MSDMFSWTKYITENLNFRLLLLICKINLTLRYLL